MPDTAAVVEVEEEGCVIGKGDWAGIATLEAVPVIGLFSPAEDKIYSNIGDTPTGEL